MSTTARHADAPQHDVAAILALLDTNPWDAAPTARPALRMATTEAALAEGRDAAHIETNAALDCPHCFAVAHAAGPDAETAHLTVRDALGDALAVLLGWKRCDAHNGHPSPVG